MVGAPAAPAQAGGVPIAFLASYIEANQDYLDAGQVHRTPGQSLLGATLRIESELMTITQDDPPASMPPGWGNVDLGTERLHVHRGAGGTAAAFHGEAETIFLAGTNPPQPVSHQPPVMTGPTGTTKSRPTFTWTSDGASSYDLVVYNVTSNKIYRQQVNGTSWTFNFDLDPGSYQVRVFGQFTDGAKSASNQLPFQVVGPRSGIQASFKDGILTIQGTNGADNIFVGQSHDQIYVENVPILVNDSYQQNVSAGGVRQIKVTGQGGDDHILLDQGDQPINAQCYIDGSGGTVFVAGARGGHNEFHNCAFIATNWAPHGTPMEDVRQGSIGNCFFLAPLASEAHSGMDLKDRIHYQGNYHYTVDLYDGSGHLKAINVRFDGSFAATDPRPYDDHTPMAAPPAGPWEFWTILYRRAFLKMTGQIDDGGDPGQGFAALAGRPASYEGWPRILSKDTIFYDMQNEIRARGNVVTATHQNPSLNPMLVGNHAYTVVSVQTDASGKPFSVTVRNPWGFDGGTQASGNPNDGLVTVSWATFQKDMDGIWLTGSNPNPPAQDLVAAKYQQLGGAKGFLGSPVGPEQVAPDGVGRYEYFQNGAIYWTPQTGAHEVHGAILQNWASLKWERSFLGYPVTDETTAPDGVGRYSVFQGGSIYWSPKTGAHEVHGAIRDLWARLGWEKGFLGYPLTNEMTAPDGVGRYEHFQGGSIYWSPKTGAHVVYGAIRDKWASLGWERSALGYPTSDEYDFQGGRRSDFQGGHILWTRQGGARVFLSPGGRK
jgi:hypothetical protein